MSSTAFDVIGDVHGQAGKLEGLLVAMGYVATGRGYRHPERMAVFIGDLIDRNEPGQLRTLEVVRSMVDSGAARIVMGNHELNAIAWHTRRPGTDDWLRTRLGTKGQQNRHQHRAFLEAVGEDSPFHGELVAWFRSLPLWLELGGARFVHACWDPRSMASLAGALGAGTTLTEELVVAGFTKGTKEHAALETLLKGPEIGLPSGLAYVDKDGHRRDHARLRWWRPDATTYRAGAEIPPGAHTDAGAPFPELHDDPIPTLAVTPYAGELPLFFGHYWRTGAPDVLAARAVCVDYSAGKNGPLVAYRWDGERELSREKLVAFPAVSQ